MSQRIGAEEARVSPFRHFAVSFSLVGFALTLLSSPAVHAAASNPYGGIVDRNVFSLKPAPLVDPTPAAPPTPPVKLFLNGITTILGNKRALLRAQIPPHPPEPAKEENYMLTEGQRDGGIEVLSIDEHAGIVKVNNNGLTETLDFVNNGAKAAPGSSVPAGPGVAPHPGIPSIGSPSPAFNSQAAHQIPTQNFGNNGSPSTAANSTAAVGSSAGDLARTSPATMHFQGSITPEEQTILIRAQQMHLLDEGKVEDAAMFPNVDIPSDVSQENAPSPF